MSSVTFGGCELDLSGDIGQTNGFEKQQDSPLPSLRIRWSGVRMCACADIIFVKFVV